MPPSLASPRRDRPALLHGTRVPQVYRRALALDWSRALRTHKLASFILKHDGDSDSDSEGEAERPPAKTGASGTAGATTRAHSAPPARLSMGGAALALTFGRHVQRRAEMQREYRSRAYGPDGERATGGARLASFTGGGAAGADVPGGKRQENRSELIDVAEVLRRHAPLLYRTFDGYASMDSKGDVASMAYNSYKIFITDCELDIAGSSQCDSAHFDQLYVMLNSPFLPPAPGEKRKKNDVELTMELCGPLGMASDTCGVNEDKRALSRHEWINALVRISVMRYIQTRREETDVSTALERLFTQDIAPHVDDFMGQDHQRFRREVGYTEAVDDVLAAHLASLANIFDAFAGTETGTLKEAKEQRGLMSFGEWLDFVRDLELIDEQFSARDATIVFVLSRMRVVDEEDGRSLRKIENLSLEDWYEALVRVAMLKALPDDAELAAAECADAGTFLLELQERPNDHAEWLEEWDAAHPDPSNAVHIKATQPADRCLLHLLHLLIRTIERRAGVDPSQSDLQVSKREIKLMKGGTK